MSLSAVLGLWGAFLMGFLAGSGHATAAMRRRMADRSEHDEQRHRHDGPLLP